MSCQTVYSHLNEHSIAYIMRSSVGGHCKTEPANYVSSVQVQWWYLRPTLKNISVLI